MNFESIKAKFLTHLKEEGKLEQNQESLEQSDVSIFMYANEFKNYLQTEGLVEGGEIISKSITDILDMEFNEEGKLVDPEELEAYEQTLNELSSSQIGNETSIADETIAEEPVMWEETPITDETITEEPIITEEAQIADETITEEPIIAEEAPIVDETITEEPIIAEEAQIADETITEEPIIAEEAQIADETTTEEPIIAEEAQIADETTTEEPITTEEAPIANEEPTTDSLGVILTNSDDEENTDVQEDEIISEVKEELVGEVGQDITLEFDDKITDEVTDEIMMGEVDTSDIFDDVFNDLLKDDRFKNAIDTDSSQEIDKEELSNFVNSIKGFDENEEDVSIDDLITAATKISDNTFEFISVNKPDVETIPTTTQNNNTTANITTENTNTPITNTS